MFNVEKKIELLAPAKDKDTAKAAIDAGADAVYIGYIKSKKLLNMLTFSVQKFT